MSEKIENLGRKFDDARKIVNKTLQETLNSYQVKSLNSYKLILFVLIPPIICSGIYLTVLSLREKDTGYYPSLIVVSIILLFIGILNSFLLIRINKSEALEVINEIKDIASEYEKCISEFPTVSPVNIDPVLNNDPTIVSGHTHVNIVTTYRNTRWQRLPTLLLAEGDIIALMAGDVTPGKVHELIPLSQKSFSSYFSSGRNDSDSNKHFKIGPLIEKGEKIYLRNNKLSQQQSRGYGGQESGVDLFTLNNNYPSKDQIQYAPIVSTISSGQSSSEHLSFQDTGNSSSSFSKNRSIPPESTELLSLSGDIRCFKLAETPIKSFCESLLENNNNNNKTLNLSNNCIKKSISTKNTSSLFPIFGKRPTQIIGECGDESAVRLLFFFVLRKGIKIMILFIILSLLFSLVRVLIISKEITSKYIEEIIIPIGTIILCFVPISLPIFMILSEAIATANLLATTEVILQSETEKQDLEYLSKKEAININQNEVDRVNVAGIIIDDDNSDEFLDDDIDERAEEIADEAYTKMKYLRIFQYFINVIRSRLLLNKEDNKNYCNTNVSKSRSFLPIPLARIRLHEVLGAVTMVCFVDDDIICEGYSVTEEIFLQTGNNQKENNEKEDAKGIVLDLHANPEATGSRFENPMWWKYLPSLKPVGLAALLTYAPTPPPIIQAAKISNKINNENDNSNQSLRDKIYKKNNQKNNDKVNLNKRKANKIEVELISHIRKTIPLEALRELAEEIGFDVDDVEVFNRMLEMNVIAPDLGDTRILEDMHSWGQEETRRRGTLISQVRGVVVEDQRGGGLQMMSQGDPSLLLNYCREYWDGSSITPLSSNDRKEVLSVYNRWDLEDFDVVAFAYTPVPGHLQPAIVNTYGNSKIISNLNSNLNKKSSNNKLNQMNLSNHGIHEKEKEKSNCIFIIDPRTYQEVEQITATTTIKPVNSQNKQQLSPISIDDISNNSERGFRSDIAASDNDIAISDIDIGLNFNIDKKDFIHSDTGDVSCNSDNNKINEDNNLVDGSNNNKSDDMGVVDSDGNYTNERVEPYTDQYHILDDIDDEIITDNDQPLYIVPVNEEAFDEYVDNIENDEENRRNKNSNYNGISGSISHFSFQESNNSSLIHNVEEENSGIFVEIGSGLEFDIERIPSYSTSVGTVETDLTESVSLNGIDSIVINNTLFKKSYSDECVYKGSSPIKNSSNSKRLINSKKQELYDSDNSASIHADDNSYPPVVLVNDTKDNGVTELNHHTKHIKSTSLDKDMNHIISSKHKHLINNNNNNNNNRKAKQKSVSHSLGSSLWSLMRQQVFLGMAASSVPIKPEVPDLMEDLTKAGVRFVYFSPRNMRRSKPVAEKIGIQFDWNCAISLRDLDSLNEHDPHRYISQYADWDVHARMPHGVESIKKHLQEVDNVPLLVSLYTDSTPKTIQQMVEIFHDYGEIVLTIGSSYRAHNQYIFNSSDVAVAIAMLPGDSSQIPISVENILDKFPSFSNSTLSRADVLLHFRLVSLGTVPLLQTPANYSVSSTTSYQTDKININKNNDIEIPFNLDIFPGEGTKEVASHLRLSALLEAIRQGRVVLLNCIQVIAMLSLSSLSLGMLILLSNAIPLSLSPTLSPSMALLFILFYIPLLLIAMLQSDAPDGIMKNTPRKNFFICRIGDENRFLSYLLIRCFFVSISVFIIGWITGASIFKDNNESLLEGMYQLINLDMSEKGVNGYWIVHDMMSLQMLLSLIAQATTLLERGQKFSDFPTYKSHPDFYVAFIVLIIIHISVLLIRDYTRNNSIDNDYSYENYENLDIMVWILLIILPFIQILFGFVVNAIDDKSYRRYLQFLRLDFDTRLGMHSPR